MAVIESTDADFQQILDGNPKVIIKFYAGWCGSCRLFAPKYKRMSDEEQYSGVVFLDIDAENNPEARKLAGVSNLPFFASFKDGKLVKADTTAKEETVAEMIQEIRG